MPVKKTKVKAKTKVKRAGYTPQSGEAAAKRNCKAAGGKWVKGKCIGSAA